MQSLTVLHFGESKRLWTILEELLPENRQILTAMEAELALFSGALRGRRLLFAVTTDAFGEDETICRFLRTMRKTEGCLQGARAAVIVDGQTELDTKRLARRLILTANLSGCAFPGKPLVEATGTLKNLKVLKKKHALPDLIAAYRYAVKELLERLEEEMPRAKESPVLLVLHASDHATSNTLALGERVIAQLNRQIRVETLSLRNGTVYDCRGCSYKVCAHYAAQGGCFYGGTIVEQVLPAVLRCDGLLLLCPNYNDSVGANIMAFINRLTSLTVSNALYGKALFAIVVSGYSGSDLVAEQVLGALCLNKAFSLPPQFCMLQTANHPGEALRLPDVERQTEAFAARISEWLT